MIEVGRGDVAHDEENLAPERVGRGDADAGGRELVRQEAPVPTSDLLQGTSRSAWEKGVPFKWNRDNAVFAAKRNAMHLARSQPFAVCRGMPYY